MAAGAGAREPVGGELDRLLALSQPAYALAVRILARREGAEDVVQQAYLNAVNHMRTGSLPHDERTWFLRVVANAAKDHLRGRARRERREANVVALKTKAGGAPGADPEMIGALDRAMRSLVQRQSFLPGPLPHRGMLP